MPTHEEISNKLNPQVVRVIRTMAWTPGDKNGPGRHITEYHDFDVGIFDPLICKICWSLNRQIVVGCTSSHK